MTLRASWISRWERAIRGRLTISRKPSTHTASASLIDTPVSRVLQEEAFNFTFSRQIFPWQTRSAIPASQSNSICHKIIFRHVTDSQNEEKEAGKSRRKMKRMAFLEMEMNDFRFLWKAPLISHGSVLKAFKLMQWKSRLAHYVLDPAIRDITLKENVLGDSQHIIWQRRQQILFLNYANCSLARHSRNLYVCTLLYLTLLISFFLAALGTKNDNFVQCPASALRWQTRRFRMLEEVARHDADVVCLQVINLYYLIYNSNYHLVNDKLIMNCPLSPGGRPLWVLAQVALGAGLRGPLLPQARLALPLPRREHGPRRLRHLLEGRQVRDDAVRVQGHRGLERRKQPGNTKG